MEAPVRGSPEAASVTTPVMTDWENPKKGNKPSIQASNNFFIKRFLKN
jgi:hypothetical protein